GTYYIGNDKLDYINNVVEVINYFRNDKEVHHIGTSKGGAAAILSSLYFNSGSVFVNAPQFRIADYLGKYATLCCDELSVDKDFLNNVIERKIDEITRTDVKYFISCGVSDVEHLSLHVLPLVRCLIKKCDNITFLPIEGQHDGHSVQIFSEYLKEFLSSNHTLRIGSISRLTPYLELGFVDEVYSELLSFCSVFKSFFFPEILNVLIEKTQDRLAVETYYFKVDDFIVVVLPEFYGVQFAVYVNDGESTYKATRYSNANLFQFPVCNVSYLDIYMKVSGRKKKYRINDVFERKLEKYS
ncbi:hypothetical protein ORJ04_21470, partial [Rheinheimera baltica]